MAAVKGIKEVQPNEVVFDDDSVMKVRDGSNLLELYHSAVYDILTTKKGDPKNPLTTFVKSGIRKLNESSLGQLSKMVKETAQYYDHKEADEDFIHFRLDKKLFGWQKEVLADDGKKATLLCGRRAGKSYCEAGKAVFHCARGYDEFNGYRKPRKVAVVGLTVQKCAEVFWQPMLTFADVSGLSYKPNSSDYKITFANGATIQLYGNSSKAEREKIRGTEYSLIIIDEAQSQNALPYLMEDILGAIIRGRDSQVFLSGTGSLTGYGYWADVTSDPKWKHYTATMMDNPTIPDHENALKKTLEDNGWTEDNITYRREYLAENVIDTTRMVIPKWHICEEVPKGFIADGCIVGVDYGGEDYNAFAPLLYKKDSNKLYLVHQKKFNHAGSDAIVEAAHDIENYISTNFKCKCYFVADSSNQPVTIDIHRRGININNAYKVDKNLQLTNLKEALGNGTIEIVGENTDFESEIKQTVWKWDDEKKSVIYEIDDDYFHPDLMDAVRYAYTTYKTKFRK